MVQLTVEFQPPSKKSNEDNALKKLELFSSCSRFLQRLFLQTPMVYQMVELGLFNNTAKKIGKTLNGTREMSKTVFPQN